METISEPNGHFRPGTFQRFVNYCRKKSPWILPFNSGGCNGCAIEVVTTLSPRNDVERFGILAQTILSIASCYFIAD